MPEPTIFLVTNYQTRQDLEADIKSSIGNGVGIIRGTRHALKQFSLSDQCRVFNCSVEATDISTSKILADKIKK